MKVTRDKFFSMLEKGSVKNFSYRGKVFYSVPDDVKFSWQTVTDIELDRALKDVIKYYEGRTNMQSVARQFVQNFKKTRKIQKNMPFLDEIPEKFKEVIKENRK